MHHPTKPNFNLKVEYLKFSLVIALTILLSTLLSIQTNSTEIMDRMRLFMGVFLTVFAFFKLIGFKMFVDMFPVYDLIASRTKVYAYMYPFIELGLGILFLLDGRSPLRELLVISFMGVGAVSIVNAVYVKKKQVCCACLGNIIRLPLSTVSFIENSLMVIMALLILLIL